MGATSCYVAGANILALTSAALPQAVRINLPESMAGSAGILAESLKDAVVAAEINRCRMKLKLYDIKNTRGEVVETQVRAEYARTGMVPLIIWTAVNRGDAAALTAVLRPALTMALPQLFV